MLEQGFVWYQDAIEFDTLTDYQNYWVKVAVNDGLEIDPIIAAETNNLTESSNHSTVILLPFQVFDEERVYVFGDREQYVLLSFTLPAGHYQLLFQNRLFTRDEIETDPHFDCEDYDYDDYDNDLELCLLTFIPTETPIEPKILAPRSRKLPTSLILYDRKLYPNSEESTKNLLKLLMVIFII